MKSSLNDVAAGGAAKSKKKRYLLGAAIALGVILVGTIAVGIFAAPVLETEKLRAFISARTGRELGGKAGLHPLAAHGYSVDSLGLVVTASAPRALRELRAHELSASFSLIELWRGKWRIDHINARHVQAAYSPESARLLDRAEFPTPQLVPPAPNESLLSVDIRKVSIARADLFWADPQKDGGQIRDVEMTCFPDGKNLSVNGRGGSFRQAKWPETRVTSFKLYYAKPSLRIDEGHLALGDRGTIDVRGNFQFEENAAMDFMLNFAHCPIAPFLTKENASKLEGSFVGDAHVQKVVGQSEALSTSGSVSAESATVKNVAALEKAAAFTGQARLHPLHLDELRGEYRFEAGKLTVQKFRAEARHVLRVRGNFSYNGGEVDGTFQFGVAPEIVAKFPGAREEVFTRVEDDYLWTDVKLTGPLSNPTDDLKPRLIAALEKHAFLGVLAPIFKTGKAAREVIELLFPR